MVHDIDAAMADIGPPWGLTLEVRDVLTDQEVEAAMLRAGDVRVELIRPTSDDSGVARFLERRGPGFHHVAYSVPDLAAALAELAAAGAELIDETPRDGLGGHLVAFVHPRSGGGVLTELVEEPHPPDAGPPRL